MQLAKSSISDFVQPIWDPGVLLQTDWCDYDYSKDLHNPQAIEAPRSVCVQVVYVCKWFGIRWQLRNRQSEFDRFAVITEPVANYRLDWSSYSSSSSYTNSVRWCCRCKLHSKNVARASNVRGHCACAILTRPYAQPLRRRCDCMIR